MACLGVAYPPAPARACPSPYNGLTCVGGNAADVCQVNGSAWDCRADGGAVASQGAEMYAIHDPTGTWCGTNTYCAFGIDGYGDSFCCETSPTNLHAVLLSGTQYADDLDFSYTVSTTTLSLSNAAGLTLVGFQYGYAQTDQMYGSPSTSGDYDETLYGGGGVDHMYGRAGGEMLYGEGGDDVCDASDGVDFVSGGVDDDTITGGAQNDELEGNADLDALNGDTWADLLFGEQDDDVLCGGPDNAADDLLELPATTSDDLLWATGVFDYEQGGGDGTGTGDGCYNGSSPQCEYPLSSDPGCP